MIMGGFRLNVSRWELANEMLSLLYHSPEYFARKHCISTCARQFLCSTVCAARATHFSGPIANANFRHRLRRDGEIILGPWPAFDAKMAGYDTILLGAGPGIVTWVVRSICVVGKVRRVGAL